MPAAAYAVVRSQLEAREAAPRLWRLALDAAEPGSGFLPLSVAELHQLGDVPSSRVMPGLDLLAHLGVLLSCPALPGCVPFKVNLLDPPLWAVDGAVWPTIPRLRDLISTHSAG